MSFWVFVLTVALGVAVFWILALASRLRALESWSKEIHEFLQDEARRLRGLERRLVERPEAAGKSETGGAGASSPRPATASTPIAAAAEPALASAPPIAAPPIAAPTASPLSPAAAPDAVPKAAPSAAAPPAVAPPSFGSMAASAADVEEKRGLDWENLVGVRLFSWIAGVALVLAALFFLRYSVERGWLEPPVRYALGLVAGLVALGFGELWARRGYGVTANAATAAGIGVLFATDYAGYARWKIVGAGATFVLLAFVTAIAVILAVRRRSLFIALLGLLSGFATPALLATGEDRPISLFGYLLLLNAGLGWVAWRMRWAILAAFSLLLTSFYQVGWAARFLEPAKLPLALGIFSIFSLGAFAAAALAGRTAEEDEPTSAEVPRLLAAASAVVPLGFAVYLGASAGYGDNAGLLFGYLALLTLGLFAVAALSGPESLLLAAGAAVALVLGSWIPSTYRPAPSAHWPAMAFVVTGFACLFLAAPWIARRAGRPFAGAGKLAPEVAAVLFVAFALLVDREPRTANPMLLFGLAAFVPVAAAAVALRERQPSLWIVVASAIVVAEAVWLRQRLSPETAVAGVALFVSMTLLLLAVPLLVRESERKRRDDEEGSAIPSGTVTFALSGLFLVYFAHEPRAPVISPELWLAAVGGLAIVIALACWRLRRPLVASAAHGLAILMIGSWIRFRRGDLAEFALGALGVVMLLWTLFVVRAYARAAHDEEEDVEPFLSAILGGGLALLVGRLAVLEAGLGSALGLLPLVQAVALAPIVYRLHAARSAEDLAVGRNTGRLALAAGALLGFVAVAVPMQLERQWITLAWALLGTALAYVHRRVRHPGLAVAATAFGAAAFGRLALNPAVFDYFPRQEPPLWNWYLYAYLLAAATLFVSARLLREVRFEASAIRPAPLLAAGGTILLFYLLNIEIADLFSRGERLAFGFLGGSAGLSEDLAYTIGWALFAIALLAVGIVRRVRAPRVAAIVLLVVTVLKAFLHDTWNLGGLYRVASLVGLAVSLALVALVLQKFVLRRGEQE